MVSTGRHVLRWVFFGAVLVGACATIARACGGAPLLVVGVLGCFWAWWPESRRLTDDRHCSECGYPFPDTPRKPERRCPECGSMD